MFSELGQEYVQLAQEPGKKYMLPLSEYNKQLLEKLVERNYLTRSDIDTAKQTITGSISRRRHGTSPEKESKVCTM